MFLILKHFVPNRGNFAQNAGKIEEPPFDLGLSVLNDCVMTKYKYLGRFLKTRRTQSGYSQNAIAEILRYTHSQFVSNWERGTSAPPLDDLHLLIKILKINRKDLCEVMLQDAEVEVRERVYPKTRRAKRR